MKGLIHIYTGDGKGKTTAAVGLSIRCAGSGGKLVFTQFLKDNESSELNILKTMDGVKLITCEKQFGFYWNMSVDEKKEAEDVYNKLLKKVVEEAIANESEMLVLDELIAAYNLKLVNQQYVLDFLRNKPEKLEVVMTGRNPAKELVDLADYVSEIKKMKHPFDMGIVARKGIEK